MDQKTCGIDHRGMLSTSPHNESARASKFYELLVVTYTEVALLISDKWGCRRRLSRQEERRQICLCKRGGNEDPDRNLMRGPLYHARDRAKIIEDFIFHDLRHAFATRLAESGVDLYKIQKLLGRYSHHCTDSLRSGMEVLDGISTVLAQSNEKGLAVSI